MSDSERSYWESPTVLASKALSHLIPAAKLIELLQALPPGCEVKPNAVRNLLVLLNDEPIGYIDLCNQKYASFSGEI